MATIVEETILPAPAAKVWAAVADVGKIHERLAPGFVIDTHLANSIRSVTFANGMTVQEPIVTIDEQQRRLVWTATGARTTHYNAALQVFEVSEQCRLLWIVDFLPNDVAPSISAAMKAAMAAIRHNFLSHAL